MILSVRCMRFWFSATPHNQCGSVPAATARHGLTQVVNQWLEFGDFHPERVRPFHLMNPGEVFGPLGGELLMERHRVMVVQQFQMISDRQFQPGPNDQ